MQITLQLRFIGECNRFLEEDKRQRTFVHHVKGNPSVKDTIESLGLPHTEVDEIIVNGKSVGFSCQLHDGDRVKVTPRWGRRSATFYKKLQKRLPAESKFVCDVHLGKLVKHLRLLGFDTLYETDFADERIISLAAKERRIVLTRDIGLLKNKRVVWGYFVRNTDPDRQIREVVKRMELGQKAAAFTRCLACNGRIRRVAKAGISHRLPPKVRDLYQQFYKCKSCGKIYWKGTHHRKLNSIVTQFKTT